MSLLGGLVVFAISWFLVLFMVLPIGVTTPHEMGEGRPLGTVPSAPIRPRLLLKFGATTAISILIVIIFGFIAEYDLLGFREFVR